MDYPEDPWNTPDPNKNQARPVPPPTNGTHAESPPSPNVNGLYGTSASTSETLPKRTTSTFTTAAASGAGAADTRENTTSMAQSPGCGRDYFPGNTSSTGFNDPPPNPNNQTASPFGDGGGGDDPNPGGEQPPRQPPSRTLGSGRTGGAIEENITVMLMPEKEGMFLFQHHNYEVTSARRGSKVIRRYSDFVWLLDCLHKRYPFRALPLLPPKRVAG